MSKHCMKIKTQSGMFGKNERIVAELASLQQESTTTYEQTNVKVLSCKSTFSSMCSCPSTRKHHVLQQIKSNNTFFFYQLTNMCEHATQKQYNFSRKWKAKARSSQICIKMRPAKKVPYTRLFKILRRSSESSYNTGKHSGMKLNRNCQSKAQWLAVPRIIWLWRV